jgi:glycosyltransferase involved in cell wall biosynthesis
MKILFAIHDFLPRHRAGSELYALHLAHELVRRGHEVCVLCAEYAPDRPHGAVLRRTYEGLPVLELNNLYRFSSFAETYRSSLLADRLNGVLAEVRPDVLHIHNLLNLSFQLPELAQARGIRVVATLHDYTLVCPSGGQRVHLAEEHVCARIDVERCSRCFAQSPFYAQMVAAPIVSASELGPAATGLMRMLGRRMPRLHEFLLEALKRGVDKPVSVRDMEDRLRAVEGVFAKVDLFVAPSPALAKEFAALGLPADKLSVSDYGFVPLKKPVRRRRGARLAIGFVGTLAWHKGVHILLEAVSRLPREAFRLHIFGNLETFPSYSERLRRLAQGLPVVFHGGFDQAQTGSVYAQLDVLVVSSLWPENSPLVIHEAYMSGIPVVGARMGGIVDLVQEGQSGLLYAARSADSLAAALRRLLEEPGLLQRLSAQVPNVLSMADDAAGWEQRYGSSAAA